MHWVLAKPRKITEESSETPTMEQSGGKAKWEETGWEGL